MQIKCTDQDLSAILIALDFAIRMWIGQYDKIEEVMRWNKDVDSIDVAGSVRPLIHRARNAVFPELTHIGYKTRSVAECPIHRNYVPHG